MEHGWRIYELRPLVTWKGHDSEFREAINPSICLLALISMSTSLKINVSTPIGD